MRREHFIALAAAAVLPLRARAVQNDADPATSARTPSLRVLLGPGEVRPNPDGMGFVFEGRAFRGTFQRLDDGAIVNLVGIEEYLYSVVPHEMPPAWPPAALAAQAICSRTYVLARSNATREYDLVPSQADQVYGGLADETPSGRSAVDSTAGQVLKFGESFARVAYSSCCGGHTESSSDAWGGAPLPYLDGVVCRYCAQSPNYRWTTAVDAGAVAQNFGSQLAPFGSLQGISIADRDPSGRARAFELDAQRGSAIVKGPQFRAAMGPRVVRSLLIEEIRLTPPAVVLQGGGLGHGVGMCQWGARGLALAGGTARDVLALYFPGTELSNDD